MKNAHVARPATAGLPASQHSVLTSGSLSESTFCTLQTQLRTHETPIVPRFFALYRETDFFRSTLKSRSFPNLVRSWLLAFGHLVIFPKCRLFSRKYLQRPTLTSFSLPRPQPTSRLLVRSVDPFVCLHQHPIADGGDCRPLDGQKAVHAFKRAASESPVPPQVRSV